MENKALKGKKKKKRARIGLLNQEGNRAEDKRKSLLECCWSTDTNAHTKDKNQKEKKLRQEKITFTSPLTQQPSANHNTNPGANHGAQFHFAKLSGQLGPRSEIIFFYITVTLPPNRGTREVDARRSLRLGGHRRLIAEDGAVVFLQ